MGLSVVHGIVKNHNGVINVKTAVGEGTSIEVYFPRAEEPVQETEVRAGEVPTGDETIMVVDDEPALLKMMSKMLKRFGYEPVCFASSKEALLMYVEDPQAYDLVVTDQTMPNIPGSSLLQELKRLRPELPVIICTGYSDSIDPAKAKTLGADKLLYKPLSQEVLAHAIREALDLPGT